MASLTASVGATKIGRVFCVSVGKVKIAQYAIY